MNRSKHSALVLIVLASLASATWTATTWSQSTTGLYIVLNARNPTRGLTRAQAKNMFMGVQSFWNGTVPVQLFTRPGSSDAARTFYSHVIEVPAQRFEAMWTGRQLAGQGVAPVTLSSVGDVAARIARTPGGISFISEAERASIPPGQVKLIPVP